ncbi:MAG: thiol:disulfide interchange protein DsbA/DsbL, partial [Steroidobacteraceae bacterium]
ATASAATPTVPAAAAASVIDVAAAAKTQQEGADSGKATDSGEAALERVAALPAEGQLPVGKWIAGTNYKALSPAQPTDAPPGKVEVVEMFWYACPHCYVLDPYLESWRKDKPAYIEFVRVPVMWGAVHRAHARLFYTLQALGKLDELHTKVFEQIHQQQDPLYVAGDDKATLQDQLHFAKANGISESDFLNAYNSFGVQANLQKADDLMRRDRIEGVPAIVIAGKYVSDVGMAGSQANLIQLTNDLAASEKHH